MSEPILVRLAKPMRGAPEDALLPADIARAMLASGEATNPRDRFGSPATPAPAPAPAPPPEKAAYKTRAMRPK